MKISEVPFSPAYLVFHDCFDKGAMEVWAVETIEDAQSRAASNQEKLDQSGYDDCGFWAAYSKLPRKRVYKYHAVKA